MKNVIERKVPKFNKFHPWRIPIILLFDNSATCILCPDVYNLNDERIAHSQLFYVQDEDPSLFDLVAVHHVKWQAEHVCCGYGAWAAFRAEVWHIHCEIIVILGCCPIDIQITVDPPLGDVVFPLDA